LRDPVDSVWDDGPVYFHGFEAEVAAETGSK
jgi:hypothetical protein